MAKIVGFSPHDANRVSKVVKRVEAMRDLPGRRQRRFVSTPPKLKFYNNSGVTIPQYAIMKISGGGRFNDVDCIEVEQVTTNNYHDCVINLSGEVGYQEIGDCTYGPAIVKYTGSAPDILKGIGVDANTWTMSPPGAGYRVLGVVDSTEKLVYVEPYGEPGVFLGYGASSQTIATATQTQLKWSYGGSPWILYGDTFELDGSDNLSVVAKHNGLYSFSASFDCVGTYDSGASVDTNEILEIETKTNGAGGQNKTFLYLLTRNYMGNCFHGGVLALQANDEITLHVSGGGSAYPIEINNLKFSMHRINAYQPQ
jgi:hypothetical protein